jgi:hypothetical protein
MSLTCALALSTSVVGCGGDDDDVDAGSEADAGDDGGDDGDDGEADAGADAGGEPHGIVPPR